MSDQTPEISVVIPAHNEAGNLAPLLEEIAAALPAERPYEVVVVDDGSTDGTAQELDASRATYPALRVIRHSKASGQSRALVTGITQAHGRLIVTLDGDGQNDPADIPALLQAYAQAEKPALVVGHRRNRKDSWSKRYTSWIARDLRRLLLGDRIPDSGCSLKVFDRETFLTLPQFNHMHRFLTVLWQRSGGQTVSVSVNHRPRGNGSSKYGFFDRLWAAFIDLFGVMWLRLRHVRVEAEEITPPGAD